jgi:anti-sigma regulatory factor (Ser/Thr protein kinase)
VCWHISYDLESSLIAPGQARKLAVADLTHVLAPVDDDTFGDVSLIISELVTNAVRAGGTTVTTCLQVHRETLRITVGDRAPGWPAVEPQSTSEFHGRGLVLVEAVTSQWGVSPVQGGKEVWAVLPLADHLTRNLKCAS